jgi:hypothetical protein
LRDIIAAVHDYLWSKGIHAQLVRDLEIDEYVIHVLDNDGSVQLELSLYEDRIDVFGWSDSERIGPNGHVYSIPKSELSLRHRVCLADPDGLELVRKAVLKEIFRDVFSDVVLDD